MKTECPICKNIFPFYILINHLEKEHNILKDEFEEKYLHKIFKCIICGKRFEKESQLNKHTKIVHGKEEREKNKKIKEERYTVVCQVDGKKFINIKGLATHLKSIKYSKEEYWLKYLNIENKTGTCKQCGKKLKFRTLTSNYADFCCFSCSTTWFAKNTDRVDRAMKTLQKKKDEDPTYCLNPSQLEYWVNKGYSIEDAKKMQKERQTTFTLEKCIEKYGEKKGKQRWAERQEKWLTSFGRIYYSQISQKLFSDVEKEIKMLYPEKNLKCFYAESEDDKTKNNEIVIRTELSAYRLDFFIPELNYVIEFDGEYWHGEARGNQERDIIRELEIKAAYPDFIIRHVLEKEYKQNPLLILNNIIKEISYLIETVYEEYRNNYKN